MGGEQAASVLRDACARDDDAPRRRRSSRQPIRAAVRGPGQPVLLAPRGSGTTACIDPADTRTVLGLALSVAGQAPLEPVSYGVFRM